MIFGIIVGAIIAVITVLLLCVVVYYWIGFNNDSIFKRSPYISIGSLSLNVNYLLPIVAFLILAVGVFLVIRAVFFWYS